MEPFSSCHKILLSHRKKDTKCRKLLIGIDSNWCHLELIISWQSLLLLLPQTRKPFFKSLAIKATTSNWRDSQFFAKKFCMSGYTASVSAANHTIEMSHFLQSYGCCNFNVFNAKKNIFLQLSLLTKMQMKCLFQICTWDKIF